MSQFCIYINMEPYLAQWFIHANGGGEPVHLIRGSIESKILEVYLSQRPESVAPQTSRDGNVAIAIPTFRNTPPQTYNYLPKYAQKALLSVIRNRFDIDLWQELHIFGKITKRQDEAIYAWMEKHGIALTETNWNAIAKRYQRQRGIYQARDRAKRQYQDKKK